MNKLFNRFLINFPKNTVFGWGAKIDKIDTMKVLGISYHKRKYMIFNNKHPYVLKIKYLDIEKNNMHHYSLNGNPSIYITPLTKPNIITFDSSHICDTNYVVISRRFENENTCKHFINDLKLNIDNINNTIDILLSQHYIKK